MKKGNAISRIWKYCRRALIDFVFIAFLIFLGTALNLMLRILPHGLSEAQISLINTVHFWYSVVLMLIFPPFAIIEVIIERMTELAND